MLKFPFCVFYGIKKQPLTYNRPGAVRGIINSLVYMALLITWPLLLYCYFAVCQGLFCACVFCRCICVSGHLIMCSLKNFPSVVFCLQKRRDRCLFVREPVVWDFVGISSSFLIYVYPGCVCASHISQYFGHHTKAVRNFARGYLDVRKSPRTTTPRITIATTAIKLRLIIRRERRPTILE